MFQSSTLRRVAALKRHIQGVPIAAEGNQTLKLHTTAGRDSLDNYKGKSYPFQLRIPLRWRDHDQMDHVNNTLYFTFFEEGRLFQFKECDFTIDVNDTSEPQPIVSSTFCKFRAPLTYPDTVTVGIRIDDIEDTSFTHNYAILSEKTGRVVAEGYAGIVFIDYKTGKRGSVPSRILAHTRSVQND